MPVRRRQSSSKKSAKSSKKSSTKTNNNNNNNNTRTRRRRRRINKMGFSMTAYVVVELILLSYCIVFASWLSSDVLNGFEPEGDIKALSFNYHPMFMSLAFPIFMTQSIFAYKVSFISKRTSMKTFHVLCHVGSFVCVIAGVVAIWINHSDKNIPGLYSVHSWMGIATLLQFVVQLGYGAWVFGMHSPDVASASGKRNRSLKYSPYHRFLGLATWVSGCATCIVGLMEKQGFLNIGASGDELFALYRMTPPILAAMIAVVLFIGTASHFDFTRKGGDNEDGALQTLL